MRPSSLADTKPRRTGKFRRFVLLVAGEKHRVAGFQSGFFRDFPLHSSGQKFGDRALACKPAALAFEDDIAEARRAFALRPIVELIEKRARLTGRAGRRNGPHDAARLDDILEGIERDIRAGKLRGHVGDDKRIA